MKRHSENPLQGKLFMSAREIMDTHAPAEGDRRFVGTSFSVHGGGFKPQPIDKGPDPRAGQETQRPLRTDQVPNAATYDLKGNMGFRRRRINLMEPVKPETDQQMWDRKLAEAKDPERGGYGRSLVEHISSGGDIPPIPLGLTPNPLDPGSTKPMVAGGQHRVAAMAHLNPDQLLPVVPYKSILDAKEDESYT